MLDHVHALRGAGWDVTLFALFDEEGTSVVRRGLEQQGFEVHVGVGEGLRRHLRARSFDLAVAARWVAAETLLAAMQDEDMSLPLIVDSVDLHFLRHARYRMANHGRPSNLHESNVEFFGRELDTYAAADAVLTVCDREAELLAELMGSAAGIVSVPLAQPVAPGPPGPEGRYGILFVGGFRHIPNLDAVEHLAFDILPRLSPEVLAGHPLSVIGAGLPEPLAARLRRQSGVRVLGWVPDVAPYLRAARASAVPLLHGAGVKGKVLESLGAGLPVVSTSVGVEGTKLIAERDVLVADDPWDFADRLEDLLTDDALWSTLSGNGRSAMEVHHDPGAAHRRFVGVVEEVVAASLPPGRSRGDARHWDRAYSSTRESFPAAVAASTPAGARVLVISGGDDALCAIPGREGSHFPQAATGEHAGFHPVDGGAALSHLDALTVRGAQYLAAPSTAFWWFHHYPQLHQALASHLLYVGPHARIYRLCDAPRRPVVAAAVPASVLDDLADLPPATCDVRAVPWDGAARPELAAANADLVVAVGPGTRLPGGFWDDLVALSRLVDADVLQPALRADCHPPPPYEAHRGVIARMMPLLPGAPVVAARPALAAALADTLTGDCGRTTAAFGGATVAVLDALPVSAPGPLTQPWNAGELRVEGIVARRGDGAQRIAPRSVRPELSVVIATYRRPGLLERCLDSFAAQDMPPGSFEVVVVDDGSDDGTAAVVARFTSAFPLSFLRIAHAGRAAAKNIGIMAAQGSVVLLFDDDDVADRDLVSEHIQQHRQHPGEGVAVLGHTTWAPGLPVSPVMRHLTEVGMLLFSYGKIPPGEWLDFRYFWEGRLSCKRGFLLEHGLHDQRLAYTIDIELGYRLALHGLKVVYDPAARSFMARQVGFDEFRERCEAKGRAARRFSLLHPDDAVHHYCQIDDAEQGWPNLAETHEADIRRVRELERVLGDNVEAIEAADLEELDRLYRRAFRGATWKGVVEAAGDGLDRPLLSVVMPVWSLTPELATMAAETIRRVHEVAAIPTEVIVVDNGSPHRLDLNATVVAWPANLGVAPAWNEGARQARGKVLAFVNSDARVEPGWDTALAQAALAASRIVFPYTDHGDGEGFRVPDKAGCAGWCFALSRSTFEGLGPFDERYAPAWYEDVDYFHRAWGAGVGLNPVRSARVRHARRTTARHLQGFEEVFERNRRQYALKHGLRLGEAPPYWHRVIEELS